MREVTTNVWIILTFVFVLSHYMRKCMRNYPSPFCIVTFHTLRPQAKGHTSIHEYKVPYTLKEISLSALCVTRTHWSLGRWLYNAKPVHCEMRDEKRNYILGMS
jgi:hypothetical protein